MKIIYNQVKDTILDVKPSKRDEIIRFGLDNKYPSTIEALIAMSVTARTCADRVAKAIYGAGFGAIGDNPVNSSGQTLNEILRIAARDFAKQSNSWLHIAYNELLENNAINVVQSTDARVGKVDDKDYAGKVAVYNNWDGARGRYDKTRIKLVDRYNPNKAAIAAQIKKAGGIEKYAGQIIHIRKDETQVYSLSDINAAMAECLLEANSQTFRSTGAERGFLNTKIMVVPPFSSDEEKTKFKKDIKELRGAKNSNEVLLLELAEATDDVSKQTSLEDLTGDYNDKLFEYSDREAERNICKAFSVPLVLVSQNDNSMFGSSGEMLREAKLQLWESRKEERQQFERVFTSLMKNFPKKIDGPLIIENPYIDEVYEEESRNVNKEAQATLRGSVGGVTAIIQLVQSVKDGTMDKENAVAVVKNIYGFSDKKAKEMVGGFEDENKDTL